MPVDEEHFESIPWSALIPQERDRPWMVYVAAASLVALMVGVLAARSLRTTSPGTGPEAAPAPVVPATTPVAPPASVPPMSEADLLAELQPGDQGPESAAMRAEWFVTDYFTEDGAGGRESELAAALGRPAPAARLDATTYVEWARAWDVVSEGDGRFRVLVAFRSITATDAGFRRGLVRGVAVRVRVDTNGGTRVVEVPEPAELPAAPAPAGPPDPVTLPAEVGRRALESASVWDGEATVVEGSHDDGVWRVRIDVVDEAGSVWPMVVWVEDAGNRVP